MIRANGLMTDAFYATIGPTRDALVRLLAITDPPGLSLPAAESEAMRELSQEVSCVEEWSDEPVRNSHVTGSLKRIMAVDCANAMVRDLQKDPRPLYAHNVLSRAILENAASAARIFEPGISVETRVARGFNEAIFSHQQTLRMTWLPEATQDSRKKSIEVIRDSAKRLELPICHGWISEERLGFTNLVRWLLGDELGTDVVRRLSAVTHGTRYGLMTPVAGVERSAPRTSKTGVVTTTVRERFTAPDWHADGWFLERRHPANWSRRTELVLPDEQAAKVDPLVGVHDELRLARLARQKQQGKSV